MSNGYQYPGGGPGQPTYRGPEQPPYPQQGQQQYPQGQGRYPQQGQPQYPQGQGQYPQGQGQYPQQGQPGYPQGQGRYPQQGQPGYPQGQGHHPQQGQPGYPQGQGHHPQQGQPEYPQGQGQYPQQGQPQYPQGQPGYPQGQGQYPQQGQPPQGQGQYPQVHDPYGGQGGGYQGPELPEKGSKKGLIIALVAVVLVIALALVAVFFFKGRLDGGAGSNATLSTDPEGYLQSALEKTSENRAEAPSPLPELGDFSDGPTEYEFYVALRNVPYARELNGFNMRVNTQVDAPAERLLAEVSVGIGPMAMSGNRIYLSNEVVALSVPSIYNRYEYITFDPNTFRDDWNNSALARELDIALPAYFDFQDIMDYFFLADPTAEIDFDHANMFADMQERTDRLFDEGSFTVEGTEVITVDGQEYEVTKLTYTFSSSEMAAYVRDIVGTMSDTVVDYYTDMGSAMYSVYGFNPYSQEIYIMQELANELSLLTYSDNMKIAYYVNEDQMVPRIALYDLEIGHRDSEDSFGLAFTLDMGGQSSMGEYTMLDVEMHIPDSSDLRFVFTGKTQQTGDVAAKHGEFFVIEDNVELLSIFYDLEWEPENKNGGNIKLDVEMAEDNRSWNYGVYFEGTLYDLEGDYRLEDCTIDFLMNGQNVLGVDFGYSMRAIDSVEIDLSDSINLFDLDMEEFVSDLEKGLMGGYSGMF